MKLIELQVVYGEDLLEKHLMKEYLMLIKFSTCVLIGAIDIWIKRKHVIMSSPESPYFFNFTKLMSVRTSVVTQVELFVCNMW